MMIKMNNQYEQSPRWNDHLSIGYMQDKIEDEDDVKKAVQQIRADIAKQADNGSVQQAAQVVIAKEEEEEEEEEANGGDDDDESDEEEEENVETPSPPPTAPTPSPPAQQQQQQQQQQQEEIQAHHPAYKILRSLPNYAIGDPLRKSDMILCHSIEAAAYAMTKLRPSDCAFILRSNGSFTYAIYEGNAENNPALLSFTVNDKGHFKVLPAKQFLARVKVPVLPVQLIGTCMDRYTDFEEIDDDDELKDRKEGRSGDNLLVLGSSSEGQLGRNKSNKAKAKGSGGQLKQLPRSTSVGGQLHRRQSGGSTARQTTLALPATQDNPEADQDDALMGMIANKQAQKAARVAQAKYTGSYLPISASVGKLNRSASVGGQLNRRPPQQAVQQQQPSSAQDPPKSNMLLDMIANKQAQKASRGNPPSLSASGGGGSQANSSLPRSTSVGQLRRQSAGPIIQQNSKANNVLLSSQQKLLRRGSLPTINDQTAMMMSQNQQQQASYTNSSNPMDNLQQAGSKNILSQMKMVTAPGVGAPSGSMGGNSNIRVASMQNFKQRMSMGALNTVPESSKLRMKAFTTDQQQQQTFGLRRNNVSVPAMAAAVNMNNNIGQAGNQTMPMPRNVTLMRISENVGESFVSDASSANASWNVRESFASNASGGSNASWEYANSNNNCATTARGNTIMPENPLLRAAAMKQRATAAAGNNENPLLKAMASMANASSETLSNVPTQQNATSDAPNTSSLAKKSKFSIGDRIRAQDMPKISKEEMFLSQGGLSKLRAYDYAWVRRSDKSWAYAMVQTKNATHVTFAVNVNGDTKRLDLVNAWRFVRILEEGEIGGFKIDKGMTDNESGDGGADSQKSNETAENEIEQMQADGMRQQHVQSRRISDPFSTQGPMLARRRSNRTPTTSENNLPMSRMSSMSSVYSSRDNMSVGTRRLSGVSVAADGTTETKSWEVLEDNMDTTNHTPPTPPAQTAEVKPPPTNEKPPISPPSPQTENNVEIEMVQCKTEDGGTKMVPMYKAGMDVYYKKQNEPLVPVRILQVHLDDLLEPYYYIRLGDGREKQTDNAHITLEQ